MLSAINRHWVFWLSILKTNDACAETHHAGTVVIIPFPSVVGKLFTSILNNRLNDWAENYNVYIEAQAGFRKGMGTTDNIFILYGLISHCINNNEKIFAAFVDFQKAFDYIVHDILWFKLVEIGVRVIKSIHSNLKSRVKFDNRVSSDFTC